MITSYATFALFYHGIFQFQRSESIRTNSNDDSQSMKLPPIAILQHFTDNIRRPTAPLLNNFAVTLSIINSWSTVLENLTVPRILKKFPAFYRTRKFVTRLRTARLLSPSSARPSQLSASQPISSRTIWKLSSCSRTKSRFQCPHCTLGWCQNLRFCLAFLKTFFEH